MPPRSLRGRNMRWRASIGIALLALPHFVSANASSALAEAGSTGGTIGKQDKSISGGDSQSEPSTPARSKLHRNISSSQAKGNQIRVTSATFGENCGAPRGNVTDKVGRICNEKETCALPGSSVNDPDPAFGCGKSFAAEWQCGSEKIQFNSVPASAWGGGRAYIELQVKCCGLSARRTRRLLLARLRHAVPI